MTRTRRSLYSLGASYCYLAVTIAAGLLATPLLIRWLGVERIGAVKVSQQWFGLALILNFALDAAMGASFAHSVAHHDRAAIVRTIRGSIRAFFRIALVTIVWIGVLIVFVQTFFNLQTPALIPELRWGLAVAALGQFSLLLAAFKPLAEAEQRGYFVYLCLTAGAVIGFALSLILAANGAGLIGQFLAVAIAPLISGLLLAADAARRYPELLKREEQVELKVPAFPPAMLIFQIFNRIGFFCDMIIIDQILGTTAVAPITFTTALIALLSSLLQNFGTAAWPALANLHKQGLHDAFEHRLVQLTRFVAIVACGLVVPAAAFNYHFFMAWIAKSNLYAGDLLTCITAAAVIGMSICSIWGWPIVSTGRVRTLVPACLAGIVLIFAVSVTATIYWGAIGPPLGILVNFLLIMVWYFPRVLSREFGVPAKRLLAAAAGPILLALPFAALMGPAAAHLDLEAFVPNRYARFVAVGILMGLGSLLYFALAAWLVLPAADRREWLGRFRARLDQAPERQP